LNEPLRADLHAIVSQWVFDHPDRTTYELVDDLHNYVLEVFGPPF